MKKYIVAILFIFFSTTSFAQVQRNTTKKSTDSAAAITQPSAKKDKKERIRELDLSKEQRIKFKELNQTHKQSKAAIEADTTLSAAQRQEKLKALKKAHADKLKTILTPEQIEKFKQSKKDNDQ